MKRKYTKTQQAEIRAKQREYSRRHREKKKESVSKKPKKKKSGEEGEEVTLELFLKEGKGKEFNNEDCIREVSIPPIEQEHLKRDYFGMGLTIGVVLGLAMQGLLYYLTNY